ncbi:CPBP family intramembrane glutamic endopeptidase [Bacillus sp. JCM 19034]|uniref:CPBP family intramembrane glutamic endopeptidase n=1 Tax=Bacillus sp. JCM 19034 TaxID=1481928 RepID=UPI0007864A8A|nr:type II CAAX endopeptidase family protein [Bacillus sp. JCM 19034]
MNIRYWWIIITFLLIQFSFLPGFFILRNFNIDPNQIFGMWNVIAFSIGFIVMLLLLRKDMQERHSVSNRSSRGDAIIWSLIGIFMAFGSQYAAAFIQMTIFGFEPGSENTEMIVEYAKAFPLFIIVVAVLGPIIEEIVFRLVIFGSLYKRFNFWIAGLLSSLIFAALHNDFENLLVYTAMGLTFAFLYVKTKRIIVPIIAHVAINLFVALVNVVFAEQINDMLEEIEQQQEVQQQVLQFIGGLL